MPFLQLLLSTDISVFAERTFVIFSVRCLTKNDDFCILKKKTHLFCRKNSDVSRDEAIKYASYFFALTIFYGIAMLHFSFNGFYYAMRVRVALSSVIYRKVSVI